MQKYQSDHHNHILLEDNQLKSYLSNRRHLDFALKLALGSEANLHDISSINNQDSNLSFQSIQNRLSPFKSLYDSPISKKVKKSKFASKQNIRYKEINTLQKSLLSNSPQQRFLKEKLQFFQLWVQFIKERCKFTNELNNSKENTILKNNSKELNKQTINSFFKEIVYRLQKLEIIEKEEYNQKYILCQLTQATIRQNQYQQNLKILQSQLQNKKTQIVGLQQTIKRLTRENKINSQMKESQHMNSNRTQSFMTFEISEQSGNNQKCSPLSSSIILKNKLASSQKIFKNQQILTTPFENSQRSTSKAELTTGQRQASVQNFQQQKKDLNQIKKKVVFQQTQEDNQQEQIEESMLLRSTRIKQKQKQMIVVQIQQCENNSVSEEKSQKNIQEIQKSEGNVIEKSQYAGQLSNNEVSEWRINQSQLLEIRQQMKKLIQENETMREQIKRLQEQLIFYKNSKLLEETQHLKQIQQLNIADKAKSESMQIDEYSNFMTDHTSKFNATVEIGFTTREIRQNQLIRFQHKEVQKSDRLRVYSRVIQSKIQQIAGFRNVINQQTNLNAEQSLYKQEKQVQHQKLKQMQDLVKQVKFQKQSLQEYIQMLQQKVKQMQQKVIQILMEQVSVCKEEKQKELIIQNQIQNIHQIEQRQQEQENIFQYKYEQTIENISQQYYKSQIQNIKLQKQVEIQQKENQIANSQPQQQFQAHQNIQYKQQSQNQRIQSHSFTSLSPQIRQVLLSIISTNERLRTKLKKKVNQINRIKSILRQARQINYHDMNDLQKEIKGRQNLRSMQAKQLKRQQRQWKLQFQAQRKKQIQQIKIKNQQLTLKVNTKLFKFIKKHKKSSKNKQN